MNGLKQIDVRHFNQWSPEAKNAVKEFFNKLDTDEDGNVSFEELQNSGIMTHEREFKYFDENLDGRLDFDEVVTLYYYKYAVVDRVKNYDHPGWRYCDGCRSLANQSYQCFWCLGTRKYDLCGNCYRQGKHRSHLHDSFFMLHRSSFDMLTHLKNLYNEQDEETDINQVLRAIARGMGIGWSIGSSCTIQ